jgi:hypothetical protein
MSLRSSGSKNKSNKKQREAGSKQPEDGGDIFLRNVDSLSMDYAVISQKIKLFSEEVNVKKKGKAVPCNRP